MSLTFPPPPPSNPLEPVGTGPVLTRCNPLGPVVTRLVYWRPSSGVDYTDFEEKDWEREKRKMFPHHRPYNTERRSFVWERKILKFLLCHNEWMRGQHKFLCSFWSSCVPTFLYDGRLHRERRKTEREREKFLYVLHHLRPYNTERRSFVWERKIKLNF